MPSLRRKKKIKDFGTLCFYCKTGHESGKLCHRVAERAFLTNQYIEDFDEFEAPFKEREPVR